MDNQWTLPLEHTTSTQLLAYDPATPGGYNVMLRFPVTTLGFALGELTEASLVNYSDYEMTWSILAEYIFIHHHPQSGATHRLNFCKMVIEYYFADELSMDCLYQELCMAINALTPLLYPALESLAKNNCYINHVQIHDMMYDDTSELTIVLHCLPKAMLL